MNRVAIKPELIRWARERSGLSADELSHRFKKFDDWESGNSMPTLKQLERLAGATMTPLGYFFLAEPPLDSLPIPDFRTVADEPVKRPSPNLLETVQTMQRRQEWMREFLLEQRLERLEFVGAATLDSNVEDVARGIRATLGMDDGWAHGFRTWTEALSAFRRAVEDAGILVVVNGVVGNNTHRALSPEEFRGFVLCDDLAPLIFVNGKDAKAAQMFTLAHELAHLWLGQGGVVGLDDLQPSDTDVERWCNRVAAEFLVPAQELNAIWIGAERSEEPFQELARRFKVSPIVAARRAWDLELISRSVFFDFYREYQEDERRKSARRTGGGDFYANADYRVGRRFADAVIRATREGRLLYKEAYRLTGLHGKTFDRYAKSLGFDGGE